MTVDRELLLQILDEARSLVRIGWCQKSPAARRGGGPVIDPTSQLAAEWSPLGGIMRACSNIGLPWEGPVAKAAVSALRVGIAADWTGGSGPEVRAQNVLCAVIADWNDAENRTKAQAVLAFDRAIGTLASKQSKSKPQPTGDAA